MATLPGANAPGSMLSPLWGWFIVLVSIRGWVIMLSPLRAGSSYRRPFAAESCRLLQFSSPGSSPRRIIRFCRMRAVRPQIRRLPMW